MESLLFHLVSSFLKNSPKVDLGSPSIRTPEKFSNAIKSIEDLYPALLQHIDSFRVNLNWQTVARKHIDVYNSLSEKKLIL